MILLVGNNGKELDHYLALADIRRRDLAYSYADASEGGLGLLLMEVSEVRPGLVILAGAADGLMPFLGLDTVYCKVLDSGLGFALCALRMPDTKGTIPSQLAAMNDWQWFGTVAHRPYHPNHHQGCFCAVCRGDSDGTITDTCQCGGKQCRVSV